MMVRAVKYIDILFPVLPGNGIGRLLNPDLIDWVSVSLNTLPLPDAELVGSYPHSSASSADDQIPGTIALILVHAADDRTMDARRVRDITTTLRVSNCPDERDLGGFETVPSFQNTNLA